jgi:hypothetical protein
MRSRAIAWNAYRLEARAQQVDDLFRFGVREVRAAQRVRSPHP